MASTGALPFTLEQSDLSCEICLGCFIARSRDAPHAIELPPSAVEALLEASAPLCAELDHLGFKGAQALLPGGAAARAGLSVLDVGVLVDQRGHGGFDRLPLFAQLSLQAFEARLEPCGALG